MIWSAHDARLQDRRQSRGEWASSTMRHIPEPRLSNGFHGRHFPLNPFAMACEYSATVAVLPPHRFVPLSKICWEFQMKPPGTFPWNGTNVLQMLCGHMPGPSPWLFIAA